jgi:ribonuclease R
VIEELMLAANEAVARRCIEDRIPIPFRIHEAPSGDKLEEALVTLRTLGYSLPDDPTPRAVQAVVTKAQGTPHETLVSWTVLRALKRAAYAAENVGHFGLAARAYTHFTSPIRRYPDLLVHRAVLRRILGTDGAALPAGTELEELSDRLSQREREAEEAERDSVLLSQIEIMKRHVGETFHGKVTGVTPFGAFIRIPEPFVEGLLHVSQIGDDYLDFDPTRIELVGRRTGMRVSLGQAMEVLVSRVDAEERRIEFSVPSPPGSGPAGKGRGRRR